MLKRIFHSTMFFLLGTTIGVAQKKAIHTMFLQETVPANGTEVAINAPILRWPYQKGKDVKYAVQLSLDSNFAAAKTIRADGLIGAVFNPHQSLQVGKWYWRHQVAGKAWSPLQHFIVTEKALPLVSPTSKQFLAAVPSAHPRILLNSPTEDLKKLTNNKNAWAIIAEADRVLLQKILTEKDVQPAAVTADEKQNNKILQDAIVGLGNDVNKMVLPLCQAFLLTARQAYAAKSIAIAMEIAQWDPQGISGSRDFTDGICMYDMALVFDTFYDQLTPLQKESLLKAIKIRAAGFYKSWVNNIESKVLSGHVWQLLLNEFFKTSLALYQHEPDAATWLAYAYDLFLARSPVLGGLDGGWAEGASYFQMNMEMLVDIPDKIKRYTSFDFIQAHPWYPHQANWLIYHFPPRSSADGFGDNTEELFEPPASYAAFAEVMARLTQNPRYSWYAQKLKQAQNIDLSKEPTLRWNRLLNPAAKVPSGTDTLRFGMAQVSKEVGIAALHTDLTNPENDIMVAMRASPFGAYGHVLSDQNTFNVLVGGQRLFYRTGYKVAMDDPHRLGWSKHTKSQNGVLINGQGQPYSAEAYGYFKRFLQGEQLAYVKGDASNAYQSAETKEDHGMQKFYRHLVLLKPGLLVIYDELEASAEAQWSWLIHSLKDMKADSTQQTFTSSIESAKGIGKLWSSQVLSWNLTDKFEVPAIPYRNYKGMRTKKYEDNQWHLKADNKAKSTRIRFLSVIQIVKNGSAVLPFKEDKSTLGITRVSVGDWEIEASLADDLPPQLLIHSSSRKTAFAAYGKALSFQNQTYQGTIEGSSKLMEWINGKIKFSEVGDLPLPSIR